MALTAVTSRGWWDGQKLNSLLHLPFQGDDGSFLPLKNSHPFYKLPIQRRKAQFLLWKDSFLLKEGLLMTKPTRGVVSEIQGKAH